MTGLGRKCQMELECPFCKKAKVKVFHKEGHMQAKKSSISAKSTFSYHKSPDMYEVLEDCPNCGKKAKDIQRAYETGITKELTHEERLERLKKSGLPTKIES